VPMLCWHPCVKLAAQLICHMNAMPAVLTASPRLASSCLPRVHRCTQG
jgi:hypothetical protein